MMNSEEEIKQAIDIYLNAMSRVSADASSEHMDDGREQSSHEAPEPEYQQVVKEQEGDVQNSNKERERALEYKRREKDVDRQGDENVIRRRLGFWALLFVGFQLFVCDALMVGYVVTELVVGNTIAPSVLASWMGSSLVEVIGILWVIARSLFPFRDKYRNLAAEKNPNTNVIQQ